MGTVTSLGLKPDLEHAEDQSMTRTIYLTGCSTPITRDANRADLGLLATPATSIHRQRGCYPTWAADNGFFNAPRPTGDGYEVDVLGSPASTPTAREVRYGIEPALAARWLTWLSDLDPSGCLFATLPDVVGDYAATFERSCSYVAKVRALGFPVAFVAQDGLEADRYIWRSMLAGADAIFLGGSTEWKLSPAAAELTAEAKARGLWVHMGRVNSYKRLAYASAIGCDSADGTFVGFAPAENARRMLGWLDKLARPTLELVA